MSQPYVNLLYHVVFSTRDREPLITSQHQARLFAYLGGIVRLQGGLSLAVNGTEDHVHLLVKLRQDQKISDLVREIKTGSTEWMHRMEPEAENFYWQNGYGAFSVSASMVERVRQYIANQEAHHRKQTFKEEMIGLLKAHEIEFDEKYLWQGSA